MSILARIIAYWFPDPLPVLQEMPAHVRNMPLDVGLLALQMTAWESKKSPAVNNTPHIPQRDKE